MTILLWSQGPQGILWRNLVTPCPLKTKGKLKSNQVLISRISENSQNIKSRINVFSVILTLHQIISADRQNFNFFLFLEAVTQMTGQDNFVSALNIFW